MRLNCIKIRNTSSTKTVLLYIMVLKEFKCPVQAQEFYLKQGNQIFWHWGYDNHKGVYTLERRINENVTDDIVRIEDLGVVDDYVYDIETEDGTFQCGPGCMVVKNTDSIYTKFTLPEQDIMDEKDKLQKIFEVSSECADRITETFKKPIELEMEKVMYPCLLFSKKRYVNLCWENPNEPNGIDAKGIQLVRRDNCPLVKSISKPILEKLMYERDVIGAEKIAREKVRKLLENKVPIDELIISKTLRSHYSDENKNGRKLEKPAHWHLVEKMKRRDPMTAPKPGDRVQYIFIENPDKNALQMDRVEDPEWVRAHPKECVPDVLYYLDRQIASPLATLFGLLYKDSNGNTFPDTPVGKREALKEVEKRLWNNAKRRKLNQLNGQVEITNYFS